MVILDPSGSYLEKPGLKANLKSARNKATMRNQFKPFEGVFGCDFNREVICNGTLFRFPLRTEEQARKSDISNTCYTRTEVESLFKEFVDACGNLLLFTQNVKSLKFLFVPSEGDPRVPQLLVDVVKHVKIPPAILPQGDKLKSENILVYASNKWQRLAQQNESLSVAQRADIEIDLSNNIKELNLVHSGGRAKVEWVIVWNTGGKESYTFALSGVLKDLLPLAAVAIPMTKLSMCPFGFYRKGHFFTFLPLPIENSFPFHINATFALNENRRELLKRMEDDKTIHGVVWNDILLRDVVPRAFIAALKYIDLNSVSTAEYYQLWPTSRDCFGSSFYKMIVDEKHEVFVEESTKQRLPLNTIWYLDTSIRNQPNIGDIALKALVNFWKHKSEVVVDIPNNVIACLIKERGAKNRCVASQTFYCDVFFPNIEDEYLLPRDRDSLTISAIKCNDIATNQQVKATKCIPTSNKGTLRRPQDCICPSGACASLFSEEDDMFPDKRFRKGTVLGGLCRAGMIEDNLPWNVYVERASTVSELYFTDYQKATQRCHNLLEYLGGDTTCPPVILQKLLKIRFLPVLQRPKTWKFVWKADEADSGLSAPNEMFREDTVNLVGCTHLILDESELDFVKKNKIIPAALQLLQVKNSCEVTLESVTAQLLSVSESIQEGLRPPDWQLCKICRDIYSHMNELYENSSINGKEEFKRYVEEHLHGKQTILVGNKLVKPEQVVLHRQSSVEPGMYTLEHTFEEFLPLFELFGMNTRIHGKRTLIIIGILAGIVHPVVAFCTK
ncbi:sacsin-like [Haliotis rufescens]|uniref:sacsin-like n=1 Tax=Haliotis rufescens TaxID=6454 RepID=UPI00201F20DC|nr:sacsin-like [Haliotis rufescens]